MDNKEFTNGELSIIMQNINDKLDKLEQKFDFFCEEIKDSYVSKVEFKPVQKIVYSLVGTVLSAVLASILYIILK